MYTHRTLLRWVGGKIYINCLSVEIKWNLSQQNLNSLIKKIGNCVASFS